MVLTLSCLRIKDGSLLSIKSSLVTLPWHFIFQWSPYIPQHPSTLPSSSYSKHFKVFLTSSPIPPPPDCFPSTLLPPVVFSNCSESNFSCPQKVWYAPYPLTPWRIIVFVYPTSQGSISWKHKSFIFSNKNCYNIEYEFFQLTPIFSTSKHYILPPLKITNIVKFYTPLMAT